MDPGNDPGGSAPGLFVSFFWEGFGNGDTPDNGTQAGQDGHGQVFGGGDQGEFSLSIPSCMNVENLLHTLCSLIFCVFKNRPNF